MIINTKNEYDELRSILVGHAHGANWPEGDPYFDACVAKSTYQGTLTRGPVPQQVIDESNQDLDNLCEILDKHKVKVFRPNRIDFTEETLTDGITCSGMHCYSTRDLLLTYGNKIISCPFPYISRRRELEAYDFLKQEATRDGARWIDPPGYMDPGSQLPIKEQTIPVLDAANVCKFDDRLLYLESETGNMKGAEWLQQQVGSSTEVVVWSGVYAFAHIDSTISSLNKDTILLNASRVTPNTIPDFLRSHKKIWVEDCEPRQFHAWPYASKWIGMNLLSIDPETVIVDPIQKKLIDQLKSHKFNVIESQLRHSRTLGGGHHCVTLDLERA
jgi:glycine amidinotransferase/scyllo-inosamine-4-phosphate amidinotransferase 1